MILRAFISFFIPGKEISPAIFMIGMILLMAAALSAQQTTGLGSEIKSQIAEDEKRVENKSRTKYEEEEKSEPFGYISFSIYPGYKRIRLDRENTIGFSENILVTAGSHWVEIISPQGYADTSFKIEVINGELKQIVVQLRDKITGQPAAKVQQKVESGGGAIWTSIKIGCFAGSILSGYLGYREDVQARELMDKYENLTANANPEDFGQHYDDAEGHVKVRNGLAAVSMVSFIAGVLIWIFK